MDGRTCLLEIDEIRQVDPPETGRRIELLAQDGSGAGARQTGVDPARQRDDEHRIAQIRPSIDVQHINTLRAFAHGRERPAR